MKFDIKGDRQIEKRNAGWIIATIIIWLLAIAICGAIFEHADKYITISSQVLQDNGFMVDGALVLILWKLGEMVVVFGVMLFVYVLIISPRLKDSSRLKAQKATREQINLEYKQQNIEYDLKQNKLKERKK